MIKIMAAQRLLTAAQEKTPSKKAVQNWLIKHYDFQPRNGGSTSNPYSSTAADYGIIKDRTKLKALIAELSRVGKKEEIPDHPGSFWFNIGPVSIQVQQKEGRLWIYTPKKAKMSLRFSPYD